MQTCEVIFLDDVGGKTLKLRTRTCLLARVPVAGEECVDSDGLYRVKKVNHRLDGKNPFVYLEKIPE